MNLKETATSNGLRVITNTMQGSSAAIGAFVNVGSRHEMAEENGIAHFLEHMAFKGTDQRTAFQISQEIEVRGAYINAMTSTSSTAYYVRGLAQHIPVAANIIGDVLTNSKYDQSDIDLESGVIIQEIGQYEDDPQSTMFELVTETAFPNQPVGRKILGTREFVGNANTNNFRSFVGRNYSAESMVVIATGGIDHDEIVEVVEQSFANLPSTSPRAVTVPATYVGGTAIDRGKDFTQVNIGILFPAVPITDSSTYAHMLLMDAFGGGMSSPLFTEVREKRGLVYGTASFSQFDSDHGIVGIYGGMTPENVEEFFNVACSEFAKLCDNINEFDLERAKNSRLFGLACSEESSSSIMRYIANSLFMYGRIVDFDEVRKKINDVTIDDLKAVAKRVMTGSPTIGLVGPVPDKDYLGLVKAAIG